MMNEDECKPRIDYPCLWVYKVIGRNLEGLRCAVAEVMKGSEHTVTPSRSSKGGAYHCLNVEINVENEPIRLGFYERLRRHPSVILVM
jgi:putative lipoic acid-binding regulatory protein